MRVYLGFSGMPMEVLACTFSFMHTYAQKYLYIDTEREGEREIARERDRHIHLHPGLCFPY